MLQRDPQDVLLLGGPVIGRGRAPDGTWELRALHDGAGVEGGSDSLHLYIAFGQPDGLAAGGLGCGGVGFANDQRPVVLSLSGHGPKTSLCYVGQVVRSATRVGLGLTDGTSTEASVLHAELPVNLWVAFTDGSAVPTEIRAYDDRRQLRLLSIDEDWPAPGSSSCWGPIDE